ncbi:MAG: tetratricopeptide repeat protein, partial [Thermodesulfobacteriota bacterium]|nr:tetratricopeptide repeat protein [Thermodesulfobacteriota bacterium]
TDDRLDEAVAEMEEAAALDPLSIYLKKELAALWSERKQYEKALEILGEVTRQDPDDIETLLMAGQIQLALKQTDVALETFEKAIARDTSREDVYHTLGNIYMQKEDYQNARRIYEQLVDLYPGSFVGYFFLGKIHTDLGEMKEAEQAFKKTLMLAPDLEEPRFRLIELYQSQDRADKARELYGEILSRNPGRIRAAMGIGILNYHTGQKQTAKDQFEKLGQRSLNDKNVIPALIRHYIDTKKYGDTIIMAEGMLKGAPDNTTLHYLVAMAYDEVKDDPMALRHFRKVTPGTQFYKNAALQIGFILNDQGKAEEAIAHAKTVIEQIPDDPEPYLYLGIFQEDLKQYEAAIGSIRKGLEVDPDNVRLLFRLGVIFDKADNKDECIATMRKVIELNPEHANALNYLGYTYADLGENLKEAEELVKEALRFKPEDGYITDSLGWIYFKKERYADALKVLLRAVRLIPDDPIILEHTGDAYLKNNNRQKALEFYRRSLKLKKEDTMGIEKKIRELSEE